MSSAAKLAIAALAVCALVLLGIALVAVCGCRPSAKEPPPRAASLRLDSDEAARLLGGLGGETDPSASAAAAGINSRCHVCHVNYAAEELAVTHAKADVGCEKCHGHCNEHCSDEDNVTPPTVMFPRAKIVPACVNCHAEDKLAGVKEHKPVLAALKKAEKVCTDCHGSHRLAVRTRRWNKQTGRLISDDGVRMMENKPKEK